MPLEIRGANLFAFVAREPCKGGREGGRIETATEDNDNIAAAAAVVVRI